MMSCAVFALPSIICIIINQPVIRFLSQGMDLRRSTWLFYTLYQSVWAIGMIPLIKGIGLWNTAGFQKGTSWRYLWFCIPPIVIFAFSAWDILSGNIAINAGLPDVIIYFLLNLSVGFYEEMIGRSFVLNLLLQKWGKTRNGMYLAVIVSSLIFGLIHLTTVILGKRELIPGIGQAVYCIYFGVFFAGCMIRFQSVWPPIILHTIFDLLGSAVGLTERFGEIEQASLSATFMNALFLLPVLLCGLLLLRKVSFAATIEKKSS